MDRKIYIDAYGPDVQKMYMAIELAVRIKMKDSTIDRIVLYANTSGNFGTVSKALGCEVANYVKGKRALSLGDGIALTFATEKTYTVGGNKDIIVACHLDSKALYKIDDFDNVAYTIEVTWTKAGAQKWIDCWSALECKNAKSTVETLFSAEQIAPANGEKNEMLKTVLAEMDNRMFNSKSLPHPNDDNTCKTYVRAICKYMPEVSPSEVADYLTVELNWSSKEAGKVKELLQKLKDGKSFRGGNNGLPPIFNSLFNK